MRQSQTSLATTLFPSSKRLEADISTPWASEDAQKHRPVTTAAVFTFWIILHVVGHMLPHGGIIITIAAATKRDVFVHSSQVGSDHVQSSIGTSWSKLLRRGVMLPLT